MSLVSRLKALCLSTFIDLAELSKAQDSDQELEHILHLNTSLLKLRKLTVGDGNLGFFATSCNMTYVLTFLLLSEDRFLTTVTIWRILWQSNCKNNLSTLRFAFYI